MLAGPDDDDVRGAQPGCMAHHGLEPLARCAGLDPEARAAQVAQQGHQLEADVGVGYRQVGVHHGCPRGVLAQRQGDALDAGAEAHARHLRAAQRCHEAVVPAPSADAALGAQAIAGELEDGARVVVEPAHQRGVLLVRDAQQPQRLQHPLVVLAGVVGEVVEQAWRIGHGRLHGVVLHVEQAQGVLVHALAGVARQGVRMRGQVRQQLLAVRAAAVGVSHAGDAQADSRHSEALVDLRQQGDHLGVEQRVVAAEGLGANLPVLAEPPALGRLVAEHRGQIPQLHRLRQLVHAVLGIGAGHGRRALRAQGDAAPAPVVEGVHLLAHDVGGGADAAHEDLGLLEGRGDHTAEAVRGHDARGHALDERAYPALGRQDVARALGGPWGHLYRLPVCFSHRRIAMRCATRSSSMPSGIISRPMMSA